MNEKEVAELRRRFRPDRNSISHVRGCYVNEQGEIISQFDQSLGMMTQDENERFLAILRKTLSGSIGRNLLDIEFDTNQVVHGAEHKLLMTLRSSALHDEEAVQTFFQKVISSVHLESNYLILLTRDAYDVPFRSKDGEQLEDASNDVFTYILCTICPVKSTKPALSYHVQENAFHTLSPDWVVSQPEFGFIFPAFDERSTNIYNALYYTRDLTQNQSDFIDVLFRSHAPMPAATQKETFQEMLCEVLEDDCSFDVVQDIHGKMREMLELHKASKDPTPLTMPKLAVKRMLEDCGVSDAGIEKFNEHYDSSFGEDTELLPKNLVDSRQLELKTPDVIIRVNPERSDLIRTEMINGCRYIMIRADDGVEVNGIQIEIS